MVLGIHFCICIFYFISHVIGLKYKPLLTWNNFLKHRYIRLSITYYSFLIISLILLLLGGESISIESVLAHFIYINYFTRSQICGVSFGHLWFLSMIMLCYITVWLIFRNRNTAKIVTHFTCSNSHVRNSNEEGNGGDVISRRNFLVCNGIRITIFLILLVLMFLASLVNIPSRLLLILFSFVYFFTNADKILMTFTQVSVLKTIFFCFVVNIATIIGFVHYNLDDYKILRDFMTLVSAIMWVILFYTNENRLTDNKVITFLSSISFEMFLIHHPLVLGKWSLINSFNNTAISLFLVFVITISGAYILSVITKYLNKYVFYSH